MNENVNKLFLATALHIHSFDLPLIRILNSNPKSECSIEMYASLHGSCIGKFYKNTTKLMQVHAEECFTDCKNY